MRQPSKMVMLDSPYLFLMQHNRCIFVTRGTTILRCTISQHGSNILHLSDIVSYKLHKYCTPYMAQTSYILHCKNIVKYVFFYFLLSVYSVDNGCILHFVVLLPSYEVGKLDLPPMQMRTESGNITIKGS